MGPVGFPPTPDVGGSTEWSVGKGMVWSIYVDPNNHDIIYAGARRGGLWRTTDGGDTWQILTKNYYGINGIKDILVDPDNSDIIYILTGFGVNASFEYSNGVFKSTDGGITWVRKNTAVDISGAPTNFFPTATLIKQPRKMAMDPDNSNVIYIITYAYILKTIDGGENWRIVYEDNYILSHTHPGHPFWSTWFSGENGLWDIEIVDGPSNNIVYAAGYKILCSTNAGSTWNDETTNYLSSLGKSSADIIHRTEISVNPNHPYKVWFLSWFTESDPNISYIVKTDNAFASTRVYEELSNSRLPYSGTAYCYNIEVSPNNENIVYVALQNIKKYDGTAYTNINCNAYDKPSINYFSCNPSAGTSGPNNPNWIHPDIRDMLVLSENGKDVIFSGNDGGVSRSISQNSSYDPDFWEWKNISDDGSCGLYVTEFYGIAGIESDPDLIVGGTQDLSNFVYDNGSWFHAGSGDGGPALIDYSNPDIMYVCSNDGFKRYIDRGKTYDAKILAQDDHESPPLAMHPADPSVIFYGSKELYKITNADTRTSSDGGNYIITPSLFDEKSKVSAFGISKSNPDVMYVFGSRVFWNASPNAVMFKSTDGGNTWSDITNGFNSYNFSYVTSVTINPENSDELWIGFSYGGNSINEKVFHSINGGSTWTALSNNYPYDILVNDLEYDVENKVLYAATDVGIFLWDRIEKKWYDFTNCLPKGVISDIIINNSARKIRASIFGYGLWEANLWFCPDNNSPINLSGTVITNQRMLANSYITSTQNTNYKDVIYESSTGIDLIGDFTGYSGFTAIVAKTSCNTGCDNSCIANLKKSSNLKSGSILSDNFEEQTSIKNDYYTIYPNPSKGIFILKFQSNDYSVKKISIKTILGKNIFDISETSPSISIDISNTSPGLYFLDIEKNGEYYSEKIILQ